MKWDVATIAQVAKIDRRGVSPASLNPSTIYVGLEHIDSVNGIQMSETVKSASLRSTKFQFTPKHVLFGKLRPYLSKIARPVIDGVCSTDILPILPGDDLNAGYLYHFLRMPTQVELASRRSSGANLPRLSPKELARFKIPIPPLAEQKRIAGILDAADALRVKRRESITQLDALPQSTFLDMFGDPFTNPIGWEVVKGSDAFRDLSYGTSKKCNGDPTVGSLPVLRIPNVVSGQIDWADLKHAEPTANEVSRLELCENDLLLVRTNGNPDYIGRCARFSGARKALFASYLIRGRLCTTIGLEAEFLKHQIEFPSYRRHVRREARTTAGNFNLSTSGIRKFEFMKPPLDLQHRFAAIVESVEQQKARLRAHLAELDALFASLQSRAFNGEL